MGRLEVQRLPAVAPPPKPAKEVVATRDPYNESLIILEDATVWRQRRFSEPPRLDTQLIPVAGLPAEQVAMTYCKHLATPKGSATVIGDTLVVTDVRTSLDQLQALLKAMQGQLRAPTGEVAPTP